MPNVLLSGLDSAHSEMRSCWATGSESTTWRSPSQSSRERGTTTAGLPVRRLLLQTGQHHKVSERAGYASLWLREQVQLPHCEPLCCGI